MTEQELAMQAMQQEAAPAPDAFTMDSLMSQYGNRFSNDQAIGDVIMQYLQANGFDVSPTEAVIQQALDQLRQECNDAIARGGDLNAEIEQRWNMIISALMDEKAADLQNLSNYMQAVNDVLAKLAAIDQAVDMSGMPPVDVSSPTMPAPETPESMAADTGEVPPEEPPADQTDVQEQAAVDTENAPEAPVTEGPAPEGPAPGPLPPGNTPSDAHIKNIKRVVSDYRKKNIVKQVSNKKPATSKLSFLDICGRGF